MNIVVTYDISDDGRRARIAARLSRYGVRIERSVYDCIVDDEQLDAIIGIGEHDLDLDRDVMHVFVQCASCRGSQRAFGQVSDVLGVLYWVI